MLALCVALLLAISAVAGAQIAGGRAGSAIAPEPADSGGRAIAVQADGAIVLAGPQGRGAEHRYRVAVVRFTPEGQLDTTFNGRGFVTTEIGQVSDFVRGVAIQSDGEIVVAAATKMGDHSEVFSLARFTSDGRLDPGFGDGGKVLTQLSSVKIRLTKMGALALQPDGKILVVGSVLTRQWWPIPARYLIPMGGWTRGSGALDSSGSTAGEGCERGCPRSSQTARFCSVGRAWPATHLALPSRATTPTEASIRRSAIRRSRMRHALRDAHVACRSVMPPSTAIHCPVMFRAASLARNAVN